jgi:hypothetical protein
VSVAPNPSFLAPSFAPAAVAAIAPLTFAQPTPPERANRLEPTLVALAAALGLIVTLQRSGALASLFASAGQQSTYARIESALGGPAIGTPRGVEALLNKKH